MNTNKQKGVSLIITFFIMVIVLAIVLSISVLLYSEVKVIRNVGNSISSFFAADSGVEKILYYDRQVRPVKSVGNSCDIDVPEDCDLDLGEVCVNNVCTVFEGRGLCMMYSNDSEINPNACVEDLYPDNPNIEHSIFCAPDSDYNPPVALEGHPDGCDPDVCDNCIIKFKTVFDGRTYTTKATISPIDNTSNLEIDSKGVFGGTGRQIRISVTTNE